MGAHYTPRAYVERLVVVTVLEPLRQEWAQVQATAERFKIEAEAATAAGDRKAAKDKRDEAVATVRAFHTRLCQTRVLDPPAARATFYMSRSS